MASWRRYVMAAGLLLVCVGAQAAVRMQAASLTLPGVQLDDVRMAAVLAPDGRPALQIQAAKVSIPALGWRGVGLTLAGESRRAARGIWQFTGHVSTHKAPGDALGNADLTILYDPDGGTLEVKLRQGKGSLDAMLPLDQASHVQMQLAGIPLAWLRGVLQAAWPDGRLGGGTLAGNVALDLAAGDTRVSGRATIQGANLDSKSGSIAAQALAAAGSFKLDAGTGATNVMFDGQLRGGQLLLGPLYAQLPSHPVGLHVSGSLGASGTTLDSLDFDDPDALRLSGAIDFDRRGNLERLDLKQFDANFPAAYDRYGTTLVESLMGFQSLATSGTVSGSFDLESQGLRKLDLSAHGLTLGNPGGSLSVAGLEGRVDWRAGTSRPATRLGWDRLSLYRIAFGPANLGLVNTDGTLTLRQPVSVGLFGGRFQLGRFAWRPDAGQSQRLAAAFALTDVDMSQLCKALGWPAFGGKLGGAVPSLTYRGNNLVFDGGLSLHVFDGSVSVTNLGLQHPFGDAPALHADIDFNQLDLRQLTSVFGFGEITGPLDGYIHGLQLVDWKPVAFSADLSADTGGKISQNAIKSLTEVGGGGIAGGIQSMALRLFKTFGYSRIGLSCTLANGVCAMGGVAPDAEAIGHGYTIVEGSGLPHITVIGHERTVDWATLVSRLKAVTEGKAAPVVR